MKQITIQTTRYYTKSVQTKINYPDNLDLDKVEGFLLANTNLKKSINVKFNNEPAEMESETCEYFVEETKDIANGIIRIDCWDIIE